MAKVHRENWNNSYRVVVREDNGRILSHKRWTQNFTLEKAVIKYKQDQTLSKDTKITRLTNVKEKVELIKTPKKFTDRELKGTQNYAATITIDGRRITARGRTQKSAYHNLAEGVSKIVLGETDKDEGFKLLTQGNIRLEKVSYVSIKKH